MPRSKPKVTVTRHWREADPDPNPGIGGYTDPRGPYGEDGYPGSTAATRENPQAAADRLHDAPARPAAAPPFGRRYTTRRMPSIPRQQANVIPAPARHGGLPFQGPHNSVNPDRVRDTETRPRLVISKDIPGGERQRNTRYYGGRQAVPGEQHTYRSASKGRHFPVTDVTVPSRYVFGGPNGGTDNLDDLLTRRRMPYTGHHDYRGRLGHARGSVRGAVLDGTRFTLPPVTKDTRVSKQGGAYGRRIRGTQRHRPTIFNEPAPWASQFYDTTADTGGPDRPGRNSQVKPNVHVSPRAASRRSSWGSRRG